LTVLSAVFGAGGGVTAFSSFVPDDKTAQLGITIAAGVSGLFGGVSGILAGIEAEAYTTANCSVVLANQPPASSLK
jgi:hypothetical protein